MILDSSAIVAVLCEEPEFEMLLGKAGAASSLSVAAPTVLESAMIVGTRLHVDGFSSVNDFLRELRIQVLPFSEDHASAAYSAFLRFGKGRHPAGLNFGDCMSYAAAKVSGHPLLFVGKDFTKTDVVAA
jgi:ribonuclease VapC